MVNPGLLEKMGGRMSVASQDPWLIQACWRRWVEGCPWPHRIMVNPGLLEKMGGRMSWPHRSHRTHG